MNFRIPGKYYLLLTFLLIAPFQIHAAETLSGQELIETLKQGGFNLYFRHEATDWSQNDAVQKQNDWLSCDGTKIRQLSEEGRQRAKRIGEFIRALNIPVSEVLASPYCRTMETARLLGLGKVQASTDIINLRVAKYFGGRQAVIQTARTILARPPISGTNRVIVAHGNIAQAATPVYPEEGEMVVFKPGGEGLFTFVGRISPDRWISLSPTN